MTKVYSSQIPHRHKALFVGQPEIEKADEVLDWAFRTMGGQATDADTVVVREMRAIASDPEAWKACGLPSGKREGGSCGVHRVVRWDWCWFGCASGT